MVTIFDKQKDTGYFERLEIEGDENGLTINIEEYSVELDLTESEELVNKLSQWIRDVL